ncbi:MAG: aspartyl protease family protein [Bacteroidales bacterium]
MPARARSVASLVAVLVAGSVLLSASGQLSGSAAAIQLQLADLLYAQSDYRAALGVYQRVIGTDERDLSLRARMGTVRSALQISQFRLAATHAATLRTLAAADPDALTLCGDSLWASGQFDEAEEAYREALDRNPTWPRAHRGMAKALASRNQMEEAFHESQAALRSGGDDPEVHQTAGAILERLRRFDEAAAEYSQYVDLTPEASRYERGAYVRSQINFLRSFKGHKPFEIVSTPGTRQYTVPFRLENDKVMITVKLNGEKTDMTLDTGAEQTVVSAKMARRLGLPVMGLTLSAGVGMIGVRGLQISKIEQIEIGALKVRNVTVLIKNPALEGMPSGEPDCLSPLALGMSVTVDYKARRVTLGEPDQQDVKAAYELPLRMTRLATVQGTVNGEPARFIVDTGGQVISLNTDMARSLFKPAERRKIALRVYGSSGLDPEAYLLPGVSLSFDEMRLPTQPVVVLNLRAPSVLLGYNIGGIIGHKLLSKYRVEFNLEKSVLRLRDM